MAKKALLDVLEQTIGKYVKNLDAESLNVAVWSGKIKLHSLELDVDAVNLELDRQAAEAPNLALPFKVVSGGFEALEVDVPWAQLTGRSVVVRASGLKVFVEPYDRLSQADHLQAVVASEEKRSAKIREARIQNIQTSDNYRLQANAMRKLALADEGAGNDANKSTFGSRLVRRIIENVQIEISDVHVSLTDAEGSAGVVLESLSLVTTDKEGKRNFVDRTATANSIENSFLYKVLQIQGFGVYLDQAETSFKLRPIGEGQESDSRDPEQSHSYVLSPLSFQAKLRQANSDICIDYSKYQLSSELSSMSILLSRNQLDLARKISREISPSGNAACPLFPEYRPLTRVTKDTSRDWWKYAVRCIGRLNGRRSWVEFFLAYQQRKRYIPLYKRDAHHDTCPWLKALNSKELDELVDIENIRSISVEGLMTWRSIADAQMEKELEKRNAKQPKDERGLFSSIFGSSQKPAKKEEQEDEPPVHLSLEELRELESMSKEEFSDPELSKDSKLCDIKFVLGAFKVNLTSYDLRQVAALNMGAVSTAFVANADGAYGFEFKLSDLEIFDMATPNSIFPSALRSLEDSHTGPKSPRFTKDGAFNLNLSKTKTGDQKLLVKLAAFEAVASPILFREVKKFFAASVESTAKKSKQNPLLAQSLSGSVDLFYDADEGAMAQQYYLSTESNIVPAPSAVSDFSNVLIDAWKEKTETKAAWVIDIDIKAPVLVVPERCSDPSANVLVFDLGRLQLKYGKINPAPKVVDWFDNHPRSTNSDAILDVGSLDVSDLTFLVGRANQLRQLLQKQTGEFESNEAVIEPIAMSLDFGVESRHHEGVPRVCGFGVIPSISLRLSPLQGSRISKVFGTWKTFLREMSDGDEDHTETETLAPGTGLFENRGSSSPGGDSAKPPEMAEENAEMTLFASASQGSVPEAYPVFHFVMGLQRLSVVAATETGESLEAHLVAAYVSITSLSDRSTVSQLRMGWFWVLDRIQGEFVRRQRLVAHSNLPRTSESFAENDKYDVFQELSKQGVFEKDYSGSTELADVSYATSAPFDGLKQMVDRGEEFAEVVVDAKFSSLFIHWNPRAVKSMTAMIENFTALMDEHLAIMDQNLLIVTPQKPSSPRKLVVESPSTDTMDGQSVRRMRIKAEMESLDIYLNSARDDYPLYILTMASAQINILSSEGAGQDMNASLVLGELRLKTPEMGTTLPVYRSLIGLAPGHSESLLTVNYCVGKKAIETLGLESIDTSKLEACAVVDLSPMRISYIHSQVLALVEYITEGILGALAAQAATSAAEAAKELASSLAGEKFFVVKATAVDVVLPQAAYSEKSLSVHAGTLNVEYRMFPDPGGGEARISLSDVSLRGTMGELMQEVPIHMNVDVALPPDEVGSLDDQALRIDIDISEAAFVVTKSQYAQILWTLDENIGQAELFLRDEVYHSTPERGHSFDTVREMSKLAEAGLTHAGVAAVDKPRRMYLNVKISVLALQFCGEGPLDPIIRMAAVDASIKLQQVPDGERISCQVSLHNLNCDDCRPKAVTRQYRSLINQEGRSATSEDTGALFYLAYQSEKDTSEVDLQIGSPQIVFIPDAIAAALGFLRVEKKSKPGALVINIAEEDESVTLERQVIQVDANDYGEDVETTLMSPMRKAATHVSTMKVSIKTKRCRFILVDLGSQCTAPTLTTDGTMSSRKSQVAETLVLQGMFGIIFSITTDIASGDTINADLEAQGDAMEVFSAFGSELRSPLQILDPAEVSAHGSMRKTDTGVTELEVRAAALTPFEVVFSMHNAALLNAIMGGLAESFANEDIEEANTSQIPLNEKETERIEQLASALESIERKDNVLDNRTFSMDEASAAPSRSESMAASSVRIEVKLTMPHTRIAIINDLQGLDEALFRFTVMNFVAAGDLSYSNSQEETDRTTFDVRVNTSILADYYDSSLNLWNELLTEPWEITLKVARSPNRRSRSKRLSTTIDLESFPCVVSFSEQFLVSLAGANRMWSIFSVATTVTTESADQDPSMSSRDLSLRQSMAASAARNLVTSLPYAVENHSGADASFLLPGRREDCRLCPNGKIQYFRFEPPQGSGYGGKRLYGQEVSYEKSVTIFFPDCAVEIGHLDSLLGQPRMAHELGDGRILLTQVVKEGKTTVLHLSSYVQVHNRTSVPFVLSVVVEGRVHEIGICGGNRSKNERNSSSTPSSLLVSDGSVSKPSRSFSIPLDLLVPFAKEWTQGGPAKLNLLVSPRIPGGPVCDDLVNLEGIIQLDPILKELQAATDGRVRRRFDVVCRPEKRYQRTIDPFVVQISAEMVLVGEGHLSLDINLEPRAVIANNMPIGINLRTPMPHTFSSSPKDESGAGTIYDLAPDAHVEVFTPGPSIAVSVKTSDMPVGGTALDWMDGGWIDLPLVPEFRLPEPLECIFPFARNHSPGPLSRTGARGSEFFISEGRTSLSAFVSSRGSKGQRGGAGSPQTGEVELQASLPEDDNLRTFYVTVCYYAVDHTGNLLFEQVVPTSGTLRRSMTEVSGSMTRRPSSHAISQPFGAFASSRHRRRISLLPCTSVPLRLLELTMDGDEGVKKSSPFLIDDVAIGEGGIDTTPIYWGDMQPSGYFAYRKLLNEHQSEIHIIPEYVVFNGSKDVVLVKERGKPEIVIEAGKTAPLRVATRQQGLELSITFIELGCRSAYHSVEKLGMKVAIINSQSGSPMGSVCMQTIIDTQGDSHVVVKIGDVKFGALTAHQSSESSSIFKDDFIRFRVRWTELRLTLNEARTIKRSNNSVMFESALHRIRGMSTSPLKKATSGTQNLRKTSGSSPTSEESKNAVRLFQQAVTTIAFSRFTVDYQRIFKEDAAAQSQRSAASTSPERAQLSVIVHHFRIKDERPNSQFPIVFDSSSNSSFLDLCIRIRGPSDADLVQVDLFDLNLAHANGISDKIVLNTSEDFVWNLFDLTNRILAASGELAGFALKLEEDEGHGGFIVSIVDSGNNHQNEVKYTTPKSDKLYNINLARVSPFTVLVTFKRNPEASRYKKVQKVRGANLMNYFMQRLKFTIERAELKFGRYEERSLKGPPDRLFESLCAVYLSRMKFKLVTLITAASLQDWKYLTARDGGGDEFVEGDLLRATGNLGGRAANHLFKNLGRGLGNGVSGLSHTIGAGIETTTERIGVGKLGVGVNSVVSGVGDGFGNTIAGVGTGAGKVFKGAGQGIGHVVGGVSGGALMMGKGIGKGIVTGDGKAVFSGFAQGATSIGEGVGQGVESAVMGAADGVLSAGQGLFSGIKSVGKGFGGAFRGKKPGQKPPESGYCFCF